MVTNVYYEGVCVCLSLTSHQQLRPYGDGFTTKSRSTDWRSQIEPGTPCFTRQVVYPPHHSGNEGVVISILMLFTNT